MSLPSGGFHRNSPVPSAAARVASASRKPTIREAIDVSPIKELKAIRSAKVDRDFAIESRLQDWLDTPAAEQNPDIRKGVRAALKDGSFTAMWNALREVRP